MRLPTLTNGQESSRRPRGFVPMLARAGISARSLCLSVDTKFIERHRPILAELLEVVLDERSVDQRQSRGRDLGCASGTDSPSH